MNYATPFCSSRTPQSTFWPELGFVRAKCACQLSQDVIEQGLVIVSSEKAWKLSAQPVCQTLGELRVVCILEPMQDEGAEENLATCIVGALLLGEPCLESRSLCIKLCEAFFDGFASHHLVLLINRFGFAQRFTAVDETGL